MKRLKATFNRSLAFRIATYVVPLVLITFVTVISAVDSVRNGGGDGKEIATTETDGKHYQRVIVESGSIAITGGGAGGTSATDDAAFTAGTTNFTPAGGIVTADSVDSGDGGAFAMLANRQQKVTLYDSSGVELAVGGGTQYTEDAAAAANPVGNAMMLVRDDALSGTITNSDGDNIAARGNNKGEQYVIDTGANSALGSIKTAVEIVDDWDESDRAKVNLIVGQAGITGSNGAVAANTPRFTLASDDPAVAALGGISDAASVASGTGSINSKLRLISTQLNTIAAAVAAATPAGENVIGAVVGKSDVLDVTLSLDTSQYADGDVLADTQSVASAFRINGGIAYLQSIQVLDEDDQGAAFDLIFLSANNAMGTENGAPNISDANARDIIGRISIGSSDYYDIGGSKIAYLRGLGSILKAAGGSTTLYVAAISRGTGTYSASGIRLKLGMAWD